MSNNRSFSSGDNIFALCPSNCPSIPNPLNSAATINKNNGNRQQYFDIHISLTLSALNKPVINSKLKKYYQNNLQRHGYLCPQCFREEGSEQKRSSCTKCAA